MILNYPFCNFSNYTPYQRNSYSPVPYTNRYYTPKKSTKSQENKPIYSHNQQSYKEKEKIQDINSNKDKELFEIFGIKLYFDDILIVCLLFFLYNEGVQDQYLFIVLVLLLLS